MSDPTRFDLDERQRAILAEMGVRVWWPQALAAGSEAVPEQASMQAAALVSAPLTAGPAAPVPAPQPPRPQMLATAPVPKPAPTRASAAPPVAPTRAAPAAAPAAPAVHEDARPLPAGLDQMDWDSLQATASECRACGLCVGRKHTDFGVGERRARWMVIADAPGESEDLQDGLFVGQAGKLLDNMLKAVGLSRQAAGEGAVYITCPVKCRPAGSRNPQPQELAACAPYLARQVALVQQGP